MTGQLMDKDARWKIERAIGQQVQQLQAKLPAEQELDEAIPDVSNLPNINDLAQFFNQLGELRNDLMHAGKRENALTAETVEAKARELWEKLSVLLPDAKQDNKA